MVQCTSEGTKWDNSGFPQLSQTPCPLRSPTIMRVINFTIVPAIVLAFALFAQESAATVCCYNKYANTW